MPKVSQLFVNIASSCVMSSFYRGALKLDSVWYCFRRFIRKCNLTSCIPIFLHHLMQVKSLFLVMWGRILRQLNTSVVMCFSILPVPRCRIHAVASSWFESFHSLSRASGSSPRFRVLGSSTHELEGGYSRRSTGKTITTKTEVANKDTLKSKTINLGQEISDGSIKTSTNIGIKKSKISEFQRIQYPDTQQNIGESRDLVGLLTIIVFDIETTGFSRENERIIEIAMQDLLGGKNSTFQTLVNPERYVPNQHIHGISTHMVSKPEIPR